MTEDLSGPLLRVVQDKRAEELPAGSLSTDPVWPIIYDNTPVGESVHNLHGILESLASHRRVSYPLALSMICSVGIE